MTQDEQLTPTNELDEEERRLQQAIVDGDAQTLDDLLDDEVVYTGPDGVAIGKTEDLDAHRSGALDVQVFDARATTSRVIGDTGLTFVDAELGGSAGGRPFSARMRYTRTWSRAGGTWRVVAAHASALP